MRSIAPTAPTVESVRTGMSAGALRAAVLDNLAYLQARDAESATPHDWYMALAYSVRDRLLARWVETTRTYANRDVKIACYLSAEFLIGPQLANNLINLGIEAAAREAMRSLGQDLDALEKLEEEPGLGNGGLGRLAACYLDSLATLQIPSIGYGLRYEFGIFDQEIRDGWQVEVTDKWLHRGNPWALVRPEITFRVPLGGHTEAFTDQQGRYRVRWHSAREVKGVAIDTPVCGYHVNTCNTLRLWASEAVESFDFADFNVGDYYGAVQEKVLSETLSKVLYPNDEPEIGKRLRLAQQYFFVSCSLQDMLRLLDLKGEGIARFPALFAAQLNDTHPSSPLPSSCACSSMNGRCRGSRRGTSLSARSPTRITRCFQKRSKPGGCHCSEACCHGRSRSSTRSTTASSKTCGDVFRATTHALHDSP